MRIYLDIETYRPSKSDAFIDEKVIAIGLLEDRTPYSPISIKENADAKFFFIWDHGDEEKVIEEFYNYIWSIVKDYRKQKIKFVIVVGFNILRFDIPLLTQKAVEYNIMSLSEINKLWHDTYIIDLFQAALPLNNMKFKDLKLEFLVKKAEKLGINMPDLHGSGKNIKQWYEKGEYENIRKHLELDLKTIRIIDLLHDKIFTYEKY